jgi:Xaa-Pro aminopeptidase
MVDFQESEFRDRVKKIRELMGQRGLDVLFVYSDMKPIGGGSVYYISGYYNILPALVLLPIDKEPSLLVSPGVAQSSFEQAKRESWVQDVRGGSDYVKLAKDILKEGNLANCRIGIDGVHLMDGTTFQRFQKEYPEAMIVNGLVEKVRFVKSLKEIELVKEAMRLTDLGYEAFINAVKPGRSQREVQAEATYKAILAGADETYNPMAAGKPWVWASYRGSLLFQDGDIISSEFNARYKGYWGQLCRVRVLGKASKEQRKVYEAVLEASKEMIKNIRPGVSGEQLWQIGMDVIKEAGYEYSGLRFGHGLGLTISEGIDIVPGEKTKLEPRCYVMVHPSIFSPELAKDEIGAIIGEPVIVTETGCEKLSRYTTELEISIV